MKKTYQACLFVLCLLAFGVPYAAVNNVAQDLHLTDSRAGSPTILSTEVSATSLQINSNDDLVQVNHSDSIAVGNDDFAVSFWFKLEQGFTGQWRSIIHKGDDDTERAFALLMRPDDNRLRFSISTANNSDDGGDSVQAIPVNQWSHISYVKEGNQLKLYINGRLDAMDVLDGEVVPNIGDLYIGSNPWSAPALATYAEVNVYRRGVSSLEAKSLYQAKFNGFNIEEQVVASGSPEWIASADIHGRALQINSNDDVGTVPHSINFPSDTRDFTIGFWMRLDQGATGQWRSVMHKGNTSRERTFAMWMRPNDNRFHFRISTTASWNDGGNSAAEIPVGEWTHITYVKQGNQLHLYINGQLDTTDTLGGDIVANNGPLYIGSSPWNNPAFAAYDRITAFKRGIEAEAVQRLYAGTNDNNAGIVGQWGELIPWPHVAVSAANLPDGRILTWSGSERTIWPRDEQTYSATWSPETNEFLEVFHDGHNMFCAHLAMSEDGQVFVNGGRNQLNSPWASLFDYRDNQWNQVDNMATGGRWYPVTVALPSGEMMTSMGTATNFANPEKWSQENGWQVLNGVDYSEMRTTNDGASGSRRWWANLSVAPSGEVFHFWSAQENHLINTEGTGLYKDADSITNDPGVAPGVNIQYDAGKMLVTGSNQGSWGGAATRDQAFTVDLNGSAPVIETADRMQFPRVFHNLIPMPNGKVLAIGGNVSGRAFNDTGTVYEAEIWDPQTRSWARAAAMAAPRNYHSVGLLLTDGRILSAGGGYCSGNEFCNGASHQNGQIYSPPYLFNADGSLADRPSIDSAPGVIRAGETIRLNGSDDIASFSLVKMSSTTHAVNTDARFNWVDFEKVGDQQFALTPNSNANILIPGYWMLFALNDAGVPSVAHVVRVERSADVTGPIGDRLDRVEVESFNASAASSEFSFSASSIDGVEYKWSFGDGSPATQFQTSSTANHVYTAPGRYIVVLTIRDPLTGQEASITRTKIVYDAAINTSQPQRWLSSSSVHFHPTKEQVWNVNPDNHTVSVINSNDFSKLSEVAVGEQPSALAFSANGNVWVTNKASASISVIDADSRTVLRTISLPSASKPHGIVIENNHAYVVLEGSAAMVKVSTVNYQLVDNVAVAQHARHIAKSVNGAELFVSAFITPLVTDEDTDIPDASAGVEGVFVFNDTALQRTINMQHSNAEATENSGPGIANYLGALAMHPAGETAYVPSKQDNILAGSIRNGLELSFDQTVRAISSRIDLTTYQETVVDRIDHDNASFSSAAVYGPYGIHLFTALEGNRQIAVSNTTTDSEILRFNVGRAPQGLALSPDGTTLAVHNFMERSVEFVDISDVVETGGNNVNSLASVGVVANELLSAQVLNGKQLFYDSADDRLAALDYMSCAACHNDGDHDGRVWDFTQFGEGIRNTTSLRGKAGTGHGLLHWTGNFDEVQDFEGQIRGFAGGTGLMASADFFDGTRREPLGATKAGLSDDLDALAAYLESLAKPDVSPLHSESGLSAQAQQGRQLFVQKNCVSCHADSVFTDSNSGSRHDVGTLTTASGERLSGFLDGLDTPTLLGLWSSAPYLHDGSAATVEDAISSHIDIALTQSELQSLTRYLHELPADNTPAVTMQSGRIENVQANSSSWYPVTFEQAFEVAPVVVTGPVSFNGGQPTTVRVRNVSPTGFEIQMDEWDYLDGYHVIETIDYLAVLPGSHMLGGLNVEARSIDLDHNWQTFNWEQEFTQAPVVFSQITSVNEASAAITRMRAITNSRVQIRIDEEEKNDRRHASEQVHMIAIQPGKGVIGDKTVLVGKTGNTVDHNWTSVVFSEPVSSPLFIGNMQTTNGGDPATIRYRNLQDAQVEVNVDEEQSANTEVAHVKESVGWLLIAR